MLCSLLRLSCRKMGDQSEIGLNSSPKWLNSAPKWLYVIINGDVLEEGGGVVTADNSTLRSLICYALFFVTTFMS